MSILIVLLVVSIRLPVGYGQQRRLCTQSCFVGPALRCELLQRLGHGWILQQRLAARRKHGELCDGLGEVLHTP